MAHTIKDVTVEQAAEILNTSKTYLQKLLDEGAIPFTTIEGQVRIQADDLMEFKKREDAERHQALIDLIRLTEELGLYDKERQECVSDKSSL